MSEANTQPQTGINTVLLGEPQRTRADVNFSLFGLPVRIHPFFWIVALFLGDLHVSPAVILVRIMAIFAAILIHELGHAAAMGMFGMRPWITLYALGGLTSYEASDTYGIRVLGPKQQIPISLAGPAAGFALVGVVIGLLRVLGYKAWITIGGTYGFNVGLGKQVGSVHLDYFLLYLLSISVLWGVLNLMPIYPLDGGKVAREVFLLVSSRNGIRNSLVLSIVTAVGLTVYIAANGQFFAAILFGYLAYSNYATLQRYIEQGTF